MIKTVTKRFLISIRCSSTRSYCSASRQAKISSMGIGFAHTILAFVCNNFFFVQPNKRIKNSLPLIDCIIFLIKRSLEVH